MTPHEIRVALYAGPFIDFIEELNQYQSWRVLYGRQSPRIRDQELILRILALYDTPEDYARPLKSFLNNYVDRRRELDASNFKEFKDLFKRATDLLMEGPGKAALRPLSGQVNAAFTEAIVVGVMRAIHKKPKLTSNTISAAVKKVNENDEMTASISRFCLAFVGIAKPY